MAVTPARASADCSSGRLPESREAYVAALGSRLANFGAGQVVDVGPNGNFDVVAIPAADAFVYLVPPVGPVGEIAQIAHAPVSDRDLKLQRTIVAFTLARYASVTEQQVMARIVEEDDRHLNKGMWIVKIGDAIAVYTRNDDGLVVKFGVCD